MSTASAAGWQPTTTRANVARQIKAQRRSYARAVLRTLAHTQQDRPPRRSNASFATRSPRWGCAYRPLPSSSSPRTSPLDAQST